MKPHIVLRLRRPLAERPPHWADIIEDKSGVSDSVSSDVDLVLRRHGAEALVTSEYPSARETPDPDEVASGLDRTYRLILLRPSRFPSGLPHALSQLASVESARLGSVGGARIPPSARALRSSPGLVWPGEMIGVPFAHSISHGLPGISIAVLDTEVDHHHPELEGRVIKRKDFVDFGTFDTAGFVGDVVGADEDASDDVGHGTHVAALACGRGHQMATGVAPECRVLAVRVLAAMKRGNVLLGAGLVDNINSGIKWAVDNGADVINMSLGVRHVQGGLPHADVIDYAHRKGVVVVAAAGNDGSHSKYYPSALPNVIAVGAVDRHREIAAYSSYGARITVLAPGTNIMSAFRGREYAASSGTSQAAPFVAGAAALLASVAQERGRSLSPGAIAKLLARTSDRVGRRRRHQRGGYGVVNLADALRLLMCELEGQAA